MMNFFIGSSRELLSCLRLVSVYVGRFGTAGRAEMRGPRLIQGVMFFQLYTGFFEESRFGFQGDSIASSVAVLLG